MCDLLDKIRIGIIIFCIAIAIGACGSGETVDNDTAVNADPESSKEMNAPEEFLRAKDLNPPPSSILAGSEKALESAVADLSGKSGVPAAEIVLVSMEAAEWGDTSLGCPQEGYSYAQMITPGYRMVLDAGGNQFDYHTDLQGGNVVSCEGK
ncbi:MAG: hypothetical protein P8Z37_05920 [Acidobacteriota bacterium]